MSASNRYFNFGVCSFASIPILGVTDASYDPGISQKDNAGDADPGPTMRVVDYIDNTFTLTTNDAMALQASLGGTRGVFVLTLLDALNKAATGGGAKVLTTNALSLLGGTTTAKYRDFATRQLNIWTQWLDPATPPTSVTAL